MSATAWLAPTDRCPPDAFAAAPDSGGGWLAVWMGEAPPVADALRADPAAFDPDGPAAFASYVLVPASRTVLFDDLEVQRARQRILAGGPWTAVTTLVSDSTRFRGSLVASPHGCEDPFARIARPRVLRVGPGLLAGGPLRLPAPVIERYAGQPWPQAGF